MARSLTRSRSAPVDADDVDNREDEEETRRPAGRRSRRSEPEETHRPSRRQSRRGDVQEKEGRRATPGGRGWAASEANRAKSSRYGDPNEFKVGKVDEEFLIKFLEEVPFWSYLLHFVNEIPKGAGKKQFTCLDDGDCALCDLNYPVSAIDLYNIADLSGPLPVVKYWAATPDPAGEIEKRAKSKSSSPLDREDLYFIVSKTEGKNGVNKFDVQAIKESDVEDIDGWEDKVLTDEDWDAIDAKGLFDKSVVPVDSVMAIREAASYCED